MDLLRPIHSKRRRRRNADATQTQTQCRRNADTRRVEQSRERTGHTREQLDEDEMQQKVNFFNSRFLRLRCVCVAFALRLRCICVAFASAPTMNKSSDLHYFNISAFALRLRLRLL